MKKIKGLIINKSLSFTRIELLDNLHSYSLKLFNNKNKFNFFKIKYSIKDNNCFISYFGYSSGDKDTLRSLNKSGFAKEEMERFIKEMREQGINKIELNVSPKKIIISNKNKEFIDNTYEYTLNWYLNRGFTEIVNGLGVLEYKFKE